MTYDYSHFKKDTKVKTLMVASSAEESIGIKILKSGWEKLYHVIIEYGEYSESEYFLMNETDIFNKFKIKIEPAYFIG
jgi:hypothetical protein